MGSDKKIRVLIADDSITGRNLLAGIIGKEQGFEIVAIAANGKEAVEMAENLRPDVISMDINMPYINGIEATKIIMSTNPAPVVIVSSIYNEEDVKHAIEELEAGAVAVMPKPYGPGHIKHDSTALRYITTLRLMSELKVVKRNYIKYEIKEKPEQIKMPAINSPLLNKEAKVVVIGSSAGGPEALKDFLTTISSGFPIPIIIVQHLDPNFISGFLSWVNSFSNIPAKLAVHGEPLMPGNLYLPPSDTHIMVSEFRIILNDKIKGNYSYTPSIDVLFESVANTFRDKAIGIIFSGMGNDGAAGLKLMKDNGSFTYVQDRKSALIYGMPGEAVKQGAVCSLMSPIQIANQLNKFYL
jgi:two-component system chemotaxis response regulator CheB